MAKKSGHKVANPFICTGYVSPEHFCDRTDETEELISEPTKWSQYYAHCPTQNRQDRAYM